MEKFTSEDILAMFCQLEPNWCQLQEKTSAEESPPLGQPVGDSVGGIFLIHD